LLVKAGAIARREHGTTVWFTWPADTRSPPNHTGAGSLTGTARDLARLVSESPGEGARALAARLGTSAQNAHYHLRRLARGGLLESRETRLGKTYYPRSAHE
jgi:predicted transcriptional regulator